MVDLLLPVSAKFGIRGFQLKFRIFGLHLIGHSISDKNAD